MLLKAKVEVPFLEPESNNDLSRFHSIARSARGLARVKEEVEE